MLFFFIPITSGDTAFRSARLIIADIFKHNQRPLLNRFLISLPLFIVAYLLTQLDFSIVWRYFAWTNQTLATVVLWTITAYLIKEGKNFWISFVPAVFMTAVVTSYLFIATEVFDLGNEIAYVTGIGMAIISIVWFYFTKFKKYS